MSVGTSKEHMAGSTLPELQSFPHRAVEVRSSWNHSAGMTARLAGYVTLMIMYSSPYLPCLSVRFGNTAR